MCLMWIRLDKYLVGGVGVRHDEEVEANKLPSLHRNSAFYLSEGGGSILSCGERETMTLAN